MGKAASKAAQTTLTGAAQNSTDISKQLQTQVMPALGQAQSYYSSVAGGDPASLARATMPQVNASREAYSQAQKQIDMTAPKGGQRDQATTSLAQGQAGDLSRILTGGVQDAYTHLANIGQFGTTGALQGLQTATGAGSSLEQLAAARGQAVSQGIAGVASVIGAGLGGAAAGGGKGGAPAGGGGGFVGSSIVPSTGLSYPGATTPFSSQI